MLLGYTALRSGSIIPGFLVHLTIDLAALAFFAGALPNTLRVVVDVGALIGLELGLMLAGRRLGLRRRMPRVIDLRDRRRSRRCQLDLSPAADDGASCSSSFLPVPTRTTPDAAIPNASDGWRPRSPESPTHTSTTRVTCDAGRDATIDELTLVHDARYVDALDEFARGGGGMLDADTVVAPGSFAAATRAAGCGLARGRGAARR